MKLRKVISGGQTGVDKTALVEAKKIGLETGGTAPKGYRTNRGPDLSLRDEYGLTEHKDWRYQPRTKQNVRDAGVTLWFGKQSPGYWCTRTACQQLGKLFHENPDTELIKRVCDNYEVVNFAGNCMETNPEASDLVVEAFKVIRELQPA